MTAPQLSVSFPPELVEAIADQVAVRLQPHEPNDPWLDVDEAADYLRCKPQRIYDLVSYERLRVAKDGRRSLFKRAWLDEVLE